MSLNFSASCAKCEKTVYNDCYLILTPQGDKFFFCSTKCIHDFCEYALSQTKAPKIKEVHRMTWMVSAVSSAGVSKLNILEDMGIWLETKDAERYRKKT